MSVRYLMLSDKRNGYGRVSDDRKGDGCTVFKREEILCGGMEREFSFDGVFIGIICLKLEPAQYSSMRR